MRVARIDEMKKGWFVGDFEPTLYQTDAAEVAVKKYHKGDAEGAHYHKIATELTVIISGTVLMNGRDYQEGDIVIIEPGEITDFCALTDAVNVVVKIPGATGDKYEIEVQPKC